MHKLASPNFMTLVLTTFIVWNSTPAFSAVGSSELELDQTTQITKDVPNPEVLEGITVTPAPKPKLDSDFEPRDYFFSYRNAISGRFGASYNTDTYADDKSLLYLLGVQYLLQTRGLSFYEFGFDLVTAGNGRIHAAKRWIFSRGRYRPYAKAGFGLKLEASKGLATIFEFENLHLRGALGFEQMIAPPLSFRAEAELSAGIKAVEATLSAGLSWAW